MTRRSLFFKSFIAVIIVVVLAGLFLPLVPQLTVSDYDTDQLLLHRPAYPGYTFQVSYIHSVNKSEVIDYFRLTDERDIMVYKTRFLTYGAGIPEPEENTDQVITVYDDYVEITEIDRLVGEYYGFFVGVTANHTITFENEEPIPLKELVPAQTHIKVAVEKISLFNYLFL